MSTPAVLPIVDPQLLWCKLTVSNDVCGSVACVGRYGTPAEPLSGRTLSAAAVEPTRREAPLLRSFLGVNGFVDDPIERLVCVGAVREYQDWVRNRLHSLSQQPKIA